MRREGASPSRIRFTKKFALPSPRREGSAMSLSTQSLLAAVEGDELTPTSCHIKGPGHISKDDRSLKVTFDEESADGFVVHSFSGDDPIKCRDYVRELLRLPQWEPKPPKTDGREGRGSKGRVVASYVYHDAD